MRNPKHFNLSFLIALLIVSFGLNWLWEMAQMPAFVETAGRSWRQTAFLCALASMGDVALILMIYGVGVVASRRIVSITGAKFYLLLSALGGVIAVLVELIANAVDSWTYSERMPLFLGLAILPILQLAILAPVALWIASTWTNRHWFHNEAQQ